MAIDKVYVRNGTRMENSRKKLLILTGNLRTSSITSNILLVT